LRPGSREKDEGGGMNRKGEEEVEVKAEVEGGR
jgi:hypothetical protein